MRSMSHMSSDSEHEGTELERKVSTRASRRLSAKRRGSSVLDRPGSAKSVVRVFIVNQLTHTLIIKLSVDLSFGLSITFNRANNNIKLLYLQMK